MEAERGSERSKFRSELEGSLRRLCVEHSDGKLVAEEIDPTLHLFNAGYVDSMNSLVMLDFIEEQYGVEISEVDLVGSVNTLNALVDYIAQRTDGVL